MADPCVSLDFLVLHADTASQLEEQQPPHTPTAASPSTEAQLSESHASESLSARAAVSDSPAGTPAAPAETACVSRRCCCPCEAFPAEAAAQKTTHSKTAWNQRNISLVCMNLDRRKVVPPALSANKGAAEILREVWEGPQSSVHRASGGKGLEGQPSGGPICKKQVEDLLQELVDIGFASAQQQRLLRKAALDAWARILPSVTTRYCQRLFALDVGNEKGADFVLWRHQNGLMLIGLAYSHFILQEARRRRQLSQGETGIPSAIAACSSETPSVNSATATKPVAAAKTNGNPLLQEENDGTCQDPFLSANESCIGAGKPSSVTGATHGGTGGSLLKVDFKPSASGSAASGKRKRGGIQLHVRMRLGTISLQHEASSSTHSMSSDENPLGALASSVEDVPQNANSPRSPQATIFGCITGELLEVNEALYTNADALLEPPEQGGWLFIAKPAKKQDWGIFVKEQEALHVRSLPLSLQK